MSDGNLCITSQTKRFMFVEHRFGWATVCGRLLHLLEDLFGLPESEMSKREGARLESSTYATEPETAEEKAATVTESTVSESAAPPSLKRRKVLEMIARNPKTFY